MTRMSGKLAAVAVAMVLVSGTLAQAAIIGSSTLVREPPVTNFTSPDAALGAPWVAYRLSIAADGGDSIQAVEASITGQLHQRWTAPDADGVYLPTGNSTNQTNGDSHFMAITTGLNPMLFANGPNEDNPGTGSPLSGGNNESTSWGVGTTMSATFGQPGSALASLNVAYIVVPKGSEPQLDIRVSVLDPFGNQVGLLNGASFGFGGVPDNTPPIVGDLGPLVGDMSLNGPHVPTPVSGTLSYLDDGQLGPPTWTLDSFTGPGVLQAPTFNTSTGQFDWDADGSKGGLYTATISASDGEFSDSGLLTVQVIVPEPATFCLIGLALVGFAGFRRK